LNDISLLALAAVAGFAQLFSPWGVSFLGTMSFGKGQSWSLQARLSGRFAAGFVIGSVTIFGLAGAIGVTTLEFCPQRRRSSPPMLSSARRC
jgi:hypothetical protein